MRYPFARVARTLLSSEQAQALPVVALMLISLIGMAGITIDIGHAYFSFRELQASTDAAALAGAAVLPASNAVATANKYSGISGGYNAQPNLPNVTMVSGYPKVSCLSTLQNQGMACVAPGNGNAVAVKQTVALPMYFLPVVGKTSLTLNASSTAAMRGGTPTPYNVVILMDSTLSMNITDTSCGGLTQMQCALNGVQILLQTLSPCATSQTTCNITNGVSANAVDRVALFTFPNVTVESAAINSSCTTPVPQATNSNGYFNISPYGNLSLPGGSQWGSIPTATHYSYPTPGAVNYAPSNATGTPTYQLLPFLSDYRTSDTAASLNPSSALVKATGAVGGCGGMLPPNNEAVYQTYFAAAIYAAQAALANAASQYSGTQNVLILLSDGDSNATQPFNQNGFQYNDVFPSPADNSGHYPSWVGECGQAVAAAAAATSAGTHVYSIAYGSPSSGCATDANAGVHPNITPCQTMAQIASAPQYFYSDYNQSYQQNNGGSTCQSSAQSTSQTSLSQIFTQIANDLTVGRLIPDSTP